MLNRFKQHIRQQHLFGAEDRILLAISGGVDSVVLAHLVCGMHKKISLAHCNFELRGHDSDQDEAFCRALAKKLQVDIHIKHLPAKTYAKQKGISIQMAARELRYAWFEELKSVLPYDFLLTAHHADDAAETILLNLFRGSGIKGLSGMSSKNGHIIRPLLPFYKKEIMAYAKVNEIKFRKDKSNDEDKYKRNLLRLKIMPLIKKINPSFETTLLKNASLLTKEFELVEAYTLEKRAALMQQKGNQQVIRVDDLLLERYPAAILTAILHPCGFNHTQINKLFAMLGNAHNSGKSFKSKTHHLQLSFGQIIITNQSAKIKIKRYFKNLAELAESGILEVSKVTKIEKTGPFEILLSSANLTFPLCLRNKKTGDKFKPFGMQGFKLVSDCLKEQKLSASQKHETLVVENGDHQIMWVIGYRSDERFKVTQKEKTIIKLKYLGQ